MKKLIYLCFLIATNQLYTAERKLKKEENQTEVAKFINENPELSEPTAVKLFFLKEVFKEFNQIRAQGPVQSQNTFSCTALDRQPLEVPYVVKSPCGRDKGDIFYCSSCGRRNGIYESRAAAERHVNRPHKDGNLQED